MERGESQMLGLRQKITLGFCGLLVVILIIGGQGIVKVTRLGGSVDVILRENYRSVIACQRMKEALERIDSGLLFTLLGQSDLGTELIRRNAAEFKDALAIELNTITLPGEAEKAGRIRDLFAGYEKELAAVADAGRDHASRQNAYFAAVFPRFQEIKSEADAVLRMNQENMSEANDRARRTAEQARRQMEILLLVGAAVAAALIVFSRKWIMRPIRDLIHS